MDTKLHTIATDLAARIVELEEHAERIYSEQERGELLGLRRTLAAICDAYGLSYGDFILRRKMQIRHTQMRKWLEAAPCEPDEELPEAA